MSVTPEREAFLNVVDRVLSVSREEMNRREEEYRKRADSNPRKRGPKRKEIKPSVVRALGDPPQA